VVGRSRTGSERRQLRPTPMRAAGQRRFDGWRFNGRRRLEAVLSGPTLRGESSMAASRGATPRWAEADEHGGPAGGWTRVEVAAAPRAVAARRVAMAASF
jgi:hypothetical protein